VRIGFYIRKRVVIHQKIYKNLPLPRWKCGQKGPAGSSHKTFSLLPHSLIPYHQHDLNTILETVRFSSDRQHSLEDTKDFISAQGINTGIIIENSQIYDFRNIFSQSFSKLLSVYDIKQKIIMSSAFQSDDPLQTVIDCIDCYQSPMGGAYHIQTSNIESLAMDFFFHYQTGDYASRDFLFGTPSQKR